MDPESPNPRRGLACALLAALLFGASAPFAKALLGNSSPQGMAGLLYLGSGAGLLAVRTLRPQRFRGETALKRADIPWLVGAVLAGGMAAPLLLMNGLQRTPASVASLLLNLETVFTAILAWLVFRERFVGRIALGIAAILAGSIVLTWNGSGNWSGGGGPAFVVGAGLAWGIDNNLTQKISHSDPVQITMIKGIVAGSVNLLLAFVLGSVWPSRVDMLLAAGLGFFGYGVSLVCFVFALRAIGTTSTIALFSVAPFIGALIGVAAFGEALTVPLVFSGTLMALGVGITATSRASSSRAAVK